MDGKKRARAHKEYESNRPRQEMPRLDTEPMPGRSKADARHRRALNRKYEKFVSSEPTGESRVDRLLASEGGAPKLRAKFFPMDAVFFTVVIALLCFGLVMMYSAGSAWSQFYYGTSTYYIRKQIKFALIGVGAMIFISRFDYTRLKNSFYLIVIWGVTLALLGLVILFGRTANGAQRWLNIAGITFQPSEVAKFTVVYLLAFFADRAGGKLKRGNFCWSVFPPALVLISIVPLVFLEHHLSATFIIVVTAFVLICNSDIHWGYIITALGFGGGAVYGAYKLNVFAEYATARIPVWRDPFSDPLGLGYQTIQSLYAISAGGLFGLGLGNSRQKQLYLPEAHNDYVFAIVCEELGMVGAIFVIALFALLIIRGFWIAMHSRDRFGALLVIGITTHVAIQALLNIAVVTNAIPVTGVSLPFFSYGGTSLIMLLAEMGVVLSVSKQMHIERNG